MPGRGYLMLLGAGLFLALLACLGLLLVGVGLLQDLHTPSPAASAAADAKASISVSERCTGLLVTGCNVTIHQDQRQDLQQKQELPPAPTTLPLWAWLLIGAAVGLLLLALSAIAS